MSSSFLPASKRSWMTQPPTANQMRKKWDRESKRAREQLHRYTVYVYVYIYMYYTHDNLTLLIPSNWNTFEYGPLLQTRLILFGGALVGAVSSRVQVDGIGFYPPGLFYQVGQKVSSIPRAQRIHHDPSTMATNTMRTYAHMAMFANHRLTNPGNSCSKHVVIGSSPCGRRRSWSTISPWHLTAGGLPLGAPFNLNEPTLRNSWNDILGTSHSELRV